MQNSTESCVTPSLHLNQNLMDSICPEESIILRLAGLRVLAQNWEEKEFTNHLWNFLCLQLTLVILTWSLTLASEMQLCKEDIGLGN